ncbi:MAG: DUF2092 domain-containing protein [Planctomycetes bacterium]|nr:DUF2092 domain-containing protein [Planctomycetota bacterium]
MLSLHAAQRPPFAKGRHTLSLLFLTIVAAVAGCGRPADRPTVGQPATGEQVLAQMVAAYQRADSYRDRAVVSLRYRRDGRVYQDEAPLSVAWKSPNRVRVQAYQVDVACDGSRLRARLLDRGTNNFDGQVAVREAPRKLELDHLFEADEVLSLAFRQGLVGYPLQLDLLLSDTPLSALRDDQVSHTLEGSATVHGHACHHVRSQSPDGTFELWIDKVTHVLRRVEYPIATFAPEIAEDAQVEDPHLSVEFNEATLDDAPPAERFAFRLPKDAKVVRAFIPPPRELPTSLFGQEATPFGFTDMTGAVVTSQTMADRLKVLLWFTNHPASQSAAQQLQRVFQQYASVDSVAMYAVCAEPSAFTDQQLAQLIALWQLKVPVVRDLQAYGRDLFRVPGAPTVVVLDGKNVVQIFEVGANPNLVVELPQIIERLLAGENLAAEILTQYQQEQTEYARALQRGEPNQETAVADQQPRQPRSSTRLLQLRPLWTNRTLKASGNILAVPEGSDSTRFLVHEGWRSIAELDAAGQITARRQLDLPEQAGISQLHVAKDAQGQPFHVAWSFRSPQVHLFDARWNRLLSYPPTTVAHEGVQEALLADLDQDGQLELIVGFWGLMGVHCVALDGRVLWSNTDASHVHSLVLGGSGADHQTIWVAGANGAVVSVDREGRTGSRLNKQGQLVHLLFGGRDPGDGALACCGITYGREGERLAIGFARDTEPRWHYQLPAGSFATQIRFVASAQLLDGECRQWLIAGPDGSVHIVNQDGQFTDSFQTGQILTGLAGGQHAHQGILVVGTEKTVEAWQVLPAATAAR